MDSVENTTETVTITAQADQTSGWWTAHAISENLPPVTARSLTSVTTQLKKVAGDVLALPLDQITITITTELPADVQKLVDTAEQQQATAQKAGHQARESLLAAAAQLKDSGWPIRDIASRLSLSSKTITEATTNKPDQTHDTEQDTEQ